MQIPNCSLPIILKHNAIDGCKYTTYFMNTNKKKGKNNIVCLRHKKRFIFLL